MVVVEKFTTYSLIQENLAVGAFVYYFTGIVISRFGSLFIEPILRKLSFLRFSDYKEFVRASKQDPKIEIFSEANNMYRTFSAMFILLELIKLYEWIQVKLSITIEWNVQLLIALLLIMFLYSYKKQAEYIGKRIKTTPKEK